MTNCYICKYNKKYNKPIEINISDYPLILLKYAYKCNCSKIFAHNKCLKNTKFCPICKKRNEPNLYVKTTGDVYFTSIINFIQNNLKLYKFTKLILSIIAGILFTLIFNFKIKIFNIDINIELSIINKIYSFLICQLIVITIGWFDDYMKIYWLYNEATNTITNRVEFKN